MQQLNKIFSLRLSRWWISVNNALASNCFKFGTTAKECYEMLKTAFGEQAMGHSQTFQWFSRFKAGRTSIDDDERSG